MLLWHGARFEGQQNTCDVFVAKYSNIRQQLSATKHFDRKLFKGRQCTWLLPQKIRFQITQFRNRNHSNGHESLPRCEQRHINLWANQLCGDFQPFMTYQEDSMLSEHKKSD